MTKAPIETVSMHDAELQSESLRIVGLVLFVAIFVLVTVIRVFVVRTVDVSSPWVWSIGLSLVFVSYELWMLRRVHIALRSHKAFPVYFWYISTIVETSVPAFAIAFLTSRQLAASYRPLATPAVLVFFIFIILSTLRLNPWISILSGAVAALSYAGAAMSLGWRLPLPGSPAPVTQTNVSLNIITLFIGGIVASAVAGQIREHLQAALREAETKRRLDAVRHDLQVARSIQQSLLPKERPQIEGFDIAGWNQPADETGGDYFDWNFLPDGKLAISLADVTGHGIGSALLAAICHAYARSSFATVSTLANIFERINQSLASDLGPGRFVTFATAVCCRGCPDIEILSAGHGPILIYSRREDRFTKLNAHGLPFGILPSFHADAATHLQVASGDLVILTTDGFFEWENDRGEDFGVQRMEAAIRNSRDLACSDIISKLYQTVCDFSHGNKQQDDLTAVIIKRV